MNHHIPTFHRFHLLLAEILVAGLVIQSHAYAMQNVTFQDVTLEAGLDYLQWDGTVPVGEFGLDREMLFMTAGAAAGDFDNDGWPDLYVTRLFTTNLLFRNMQDGTFEEMGEAAGVDLNARSSGCVWGDVDNDGDLDLYVLTLDRRGRNHLYMNNGDGTFNESAISRGVAVRAELDFYSEFRFPTRLCARCCTSATFGDYDLDGDLDLVVVEWGQHDDPANLLFRNDGTGHFEDVTEEAGVSMPFVRGFAPRFADITGNGYPDLLVAADFGTSRLFVNLGSGRFADATTIAKVGTDENGMGAAIGDIDNDGDLDWFVASIFDPDDICEGGKYCNWGTTGNRLYRNITLSKLPVSIRFEDTTDLSGVRDGGWGWGASFFDFDNDGDLDLGMTNGIIMPGIHWEDPFNTDVLRLWQNDGSGVMSEIAQEVGFDDDRAGQGFVVFDYDRDGDTDVFIANNGDSPVLYQNQGGDNNDWLRVSLRGIPTNSFGIGARIHVQVTENGPIQMREVALGSNYMSHDELETHFGLGSNVTSIHHLWVEWPVSGIRQDFFNVAPNQLLQIEELD